MRIEDLVQMNRKCSAALLFLALPFATGCVAAATPGGVYVAAAPPAAIVETRPIAPGPNSVWIDGHYRWTGSRYDWVPGHWDARPRAGARWVPGHWKRSRHGWRWTPGRWK